MLRALPFAILFAAACVPPATAPAPSAGTREMAAEPAPAGPPAVEAPAQPGPLRVLEPTLTPAPGRVRVRKLVHGGLGASFSPDGATLLAIRGRGGVILDDRAKPRALPRRHFVASRFSPDGVHLALLDERGRLIVMAVASGKTVADVAQAGKPLWVGADRLRYLRGCGVHELTVGGRPRVVGSLPRPCGKNVHTSANGERWWLAEPGRYRRGVIQTYRKLAVHDLATGRTEVVLEGTDDGHVMEPRVSANGETVCWLDAAFDLHCRRGDVTERVWRNVRRPVVVHESGQRVLFAVGKHTSADSRVGVADLERRTLTFVPRAGRQWWEFLGADRIAGHGGSSSALVHDLGAGWTCDVGDAGSEWEGLFPTPGDHGRFIVGRERGGSRDLYLGTIP